MTKLTEKVEKDAHGNVQLSGSGALGDLLAEGSRRAARRIGGEAPAFACHVKGLELPGYEPRALQAMAVGLAVLSGWFLLRMLPIAGWLPSTA